MSTTVTSRYKREAEAGVAEEINNSKKEEQIRDKNEDEEFIKEIFTKDIVVFEAIILWIERVPMFCLPFLSCFGIAVEILSGINLIYAVIFIGRLMLCPSAIVRDAYSLGALEAFFFLIVPL